MPYPFAKNNLHSNGKTVRTTSAAGGRFYGGSAPCPLPKNRMEWNAVQQGLKRLLGYIQIAAFHMVIYNPDCLHIRIYNRTAYKLKAAFF